MVPRLRLLDFSQHMLIPISTGLDASCGYFSDSTARLVSELGGKWKVIVDYNNA
jgi:hypothetical protein